MIPGKKHDAILLKYYLGECSDEEKEFVINWLKQEAANQTYFSNLVDFNKLSAIKDQLNNIDVDKEWQHCQEAGDHSWNDLVQLHALAGEREEIAHTSHPALRKILFRLSAAAAVIAALLFGVPAVYKYIKIDEVKNNVSTSKKTISGTRNDHLPIVLLRLQNTGGKIKERTLPDGSTVRLYRNSEFTYQQPADKSRREVLLTGMAEFEVAKDPAKPFIVYSGLLHTTAVGTRFVVTAYRHENRISVFLKEGKVIISSNQNSGEKQVKDLVLAPGEEMIYDRTRQSALVLASANKNTAAVKEKLNCKGTPDSTVVPNLGRASWFMFNKQPLNEILDVLSKKYKTTIVYTKKDIDQLYLIGIFDRSDSLEDILNQIASLNNLKITKSEGTYTVEKQDSR